MNQIPFLFRNFCIYYIFKFETFCLRTFCDRIMNHIKKTMSINSLHNSQRHLKCELTLKFLYPVKKNLYSIVVQTRCFSQKSLMVTTRKGTKRKKNVLKLFISDLIRMMLCVQFSVIHKYLYLSLLCCSPHTSIICVEYEDIQSTQGSVGGVAQYKEEGREGNLIKYMFFYWS